MTAMAKPEYRDVRLIGGGVPPYGGKLRRQLGTGYEHQGNRV